jgi:hypothetical protein
VRKSSIKSTLSLLFVIFSKRLTVSLQFPNILLDSLGHLCHPVLGPLLHLLIAKVIDDGQFVKVFIFSNLLLDRLVDI